MPLAERQAIANAWNLEEARAAARQQAEAAIRYRRQRAVAYRDELGKETGDFISTLGDVLDVLIAELRARGEPATGDAANLFAKVDDIKARHPKP